MKCILCDCTDDHACEDGCAWLSEDPPVCTTHVPELIENAFRWWAFISSERFSVLGTAGKGATMHIGFELWGKHPPQSDRAQLATLDARKLLTKYADDRRKQGYR